MPLTYQQQRELEKYKADLTIDVQHQKVGADFAILVIRSLIVVSGGGIIAILTFIGNLWTKQEPTAQKLAAGMGDAIKLFALALLLSILTAAFAYASALAKGYGVPRASLVIVNVSRAVAILLALGALLALGSAFWIAATGFAIGNHAV